MTYTEFEEFLEQFEINLDDYIPKSENDTDYPKQAGRMWFQNTNLWAVIFSDPKLKPAQKYLDKNYFDAVADTRIFTEAFIPLYEMGKMKRKYVLNYFFRAIKFGKLDVEAILYKAIIQKRGLFRELLNYCQKNHIKLERSDCYGNIEDGAGLIEAVRCGNNRIAHILINNGADVTKRESLALSIAVKKGSYTVALELLKHGADIHAKNDLVYKTFLKNEDKRWCPAGEEQSHNTLLFAFKNAECKSGRENRNNG